MDLTKIRKKEIKMTLDTSSSNNAKSYEEILKKIRQWLDETSLAHTVKIGTQHNDNYLFIVELANPQGVIIYSHKNLPDRLLFSGTWRFADQHKLAIKQMDQKKFSTFVYNFTDKLTTYGVDWNFDINGQEINSMSVTNFVYYENVTRDTFFQLLMRLIIVYSQAGRFIGYYLNDEIDNPATRISNVPTKTAPYI